MDDRMLDGDRVLWFIGGSPERAQEALAAGHAWTPEQRAQLEQIAASAGYSPQQPAGYPPAQQQVPVQEPAPMYGAPAQPAAFDGVFKWVSDGWVLFCLNYHPAFIIVFFKNIKNWSEIDYAITWYGECAFTNTFQKAKIICFYFSNDFITHIF